MLTQTVTGESIVGMLPDGILQWHMQLLSDRLSTVRCGKCHVRGVCSSFVSITGDWARFYAVLSCDFCNERNKVSMMDITPEHGCSEHT